MAHSPENHAFIVRLYASEDGQLRGTITHALSRRHQRLKQPEDVLAFLTPYLETLDVRMGLRSRLILRLACHMSQTSTPLIAPDR